MKEIFKAGDIKAFKAVIKPADVATFQGAIVHPVYSTFALARDAEWTTRQFVLEMKEADEEGVGTFLMVRHQGPAFVGEEVTFRGIYEGIKDGELRCSFEARVGSRTIATGETGQKILKLEKIKSLFNHG